MWAPRPQSFLQSSFSNRTRPWWGVGGLTATEARPALGDQLKSHRGATASALPLTPVDAHTGAEGCPLLSSQRGCQVGDLLGHTPAVPLSPGPVFCL